MRTRRLAAVALAAGLAAALATPPAAAAPPAGAGDLDRLAAWLTGSFSSAAQAARDTNFFDIRLRIVPIWKHRAGEHWRYVEQAAAAKLDRPYRQRVYRATATPDGGLESAVFALRDPLRFAGEWKKDAPLAGLTPDSLLAREGCSVLLKWADGRFVGGTRGTGCASDLRGAAHATSEVTVEKDRMLSLDRGWDAAGKQAWGSTAGPYEFRRVKE